MTSLYFLIPIALIFVAIAIRVLLWAINSGQYDNLDTEAHRILFDDDESEAKSKSDIDSVHPRPDSPDSAGSTSDDH
ncbi:cbb3-type cytochrome oxidase assembly protein CcoS [Gilvimarinus sp. SDUM040013]|uniref:Cbb3-type cytochrome oxidase assembly protein CcoS n=1 Tax=Gilvimarinus gilvus TaxID=3058038 RepID=A0ABU4RWD1_9GAMM|nr:cbb3-type cytochrome oxidase assembly protein CcoS [Gilvimarinus sp. SDUM040013]MDO3387107.1 cbb3-type cytochrome oxidase assembly protein CcoS [Gilvimarinus sp. SDUM040013]MDX6847998.1 cbb3-type cytochrome oxidase assembly protein CcoS [Gilvimarinus sp. SDUM040013]